MKKITSLFLAGVILTLLLAGCSGMEQMKNAVTVVSREDGSGTRGAFVELFGIEKKDDNGNREDLTTLESLVVSKTDVMLYQVSSNDKAIGYVSLGSLNDTVRALEIDGAKATEENIKNGSYKIARPLLLATKGEPEGLTKDFIDFILSAQGQKIVSESCVSVNDDAASYQGDRPAGKIVISGSSSVLPVVEKLKEAYVKLNTNATIEIQQSDSTAGMQSVINGTSDIGMASRDLKASEKSQLRETKIALDGIAVIVSADNPRTAMTSEQVRKIYTGEYATWDQVQ